MATIIKIIFLLTLLFGVVLACSKEQVVTPDLQARYIRHPQLDHLDEPVRRAIEMSVQEWSSLERASQDPIERGPYYADLAKVYFAYGFYGAAADAFDVALQLVPEQGEWHYYRGLALLEVREFQEAFNELTQALNYTDSTVIRYRRAQVAVELGQLDLAATQIEQLRQSGYQEAALDVLAARIAVEQGKYELAEENYRTALEKQPDASRLYTPLAMVAREQGNIKQASSILTLIGNTESHVSDPYLQSILQTKRTAQSYLDAGQQQLVQRDYARAAELFSKAIDLEPSNPDARLPYGRALEILGERAEAEKQYLRAVELRSINPVAHYFTGAFFERQRQDDQAIYHFGMAVQQDPSYVPPRLLLAHALLRNQRFAEAARQYEEVVQRNNSHLQAYRYLGLAKLAIGACDEAVSAFERAYAINESAVEIKEGLARTFAICSNDEGQLGNALEAAEFLMETRPDTGSAQTLAMVHAALRNFEQAIEYQNLAIERDDSGSVLSLQDQLTHYQSGSRAPEAWPKTSPVYQPPRLTAHAQK